MFNVGSTEVILVFIVALLVIGPEKLPSAVKTAGLWIGRFRRSFYKVKSEIERELNTDEIKRQLHNESVLQDLDEAKKTVTQIADDTKESVNNIVRSDDLDPGLGKSLNEVEEIAKSLEAENQDEIRKGVEEVANSPETENTIHAEIKPIAEPDEDSASVADTENETPTEKTAVQP